MATDSVFFVERHIDESDRCRVVILPRVVVARDGDKVHYITKEGTLSTTSLRYPGNCGTLEEALRLQREASEERWP